MDNATGAGADLIEAGYRLTLPEQRIILYAIAEARRTRNDLSADNLVDITAASYAAMFDVPPRQAYEQLKDAALTLFERHVILHDICPKTGRPEAVKMRWLSAVRHNDAAETIRLRFAPDIAPFIGQLEAQFSRYKLEKAAGMSNTYATRLHKLLKQWGGIGNREVELEWLKQALMVDEEHGRPGNFKRSVVDVAVAQINEHSDLTLSYATRKTGRDVTHLILTFAPKQAARPQPAPPINAPESALLQRLRNHGISAALATEWIQKNEARAQAAVAYVEAQAKAGQLNGPTAGYLHTVFESGADIGASAPNAELKVQTDAASAARRVWQQEAEAQRAEAEKARREREAMDTAMAWFETLPKSEKQALETAFLAEANVIDAGRFRKNGSASLGFRFFVKRAWRATHPDPAA